MIELDKAITTMHVSWLNVTAQRFGDVVLTSGVVKYNKEEFKQRATIAEGMPTCIGGPNSYTQRPRYPEGYRSLATPTYRGSTTLFGRQADVKDDWQQADGYSYGMYGTPTVLERWLG